ncbi:hypothetical protein MAF45_10195 [Mesosutterella sp. OilRF-GAM-744-9]|nr:hypothetical protein [Mesosutterella sp. oilRF-744-WT-GAM-9]
MEDDTKERLDRLEAFMDEQRLEKVQQAAIDNYKKERFHYWKERVLVACALIGGVLGVIGFVRSL